MTETVIKALVSYGALGVTTILAVAGMIRLYRDNQSLRDQHEKERRSWEERYIAKAETMMTKYHEFAESANSVIGALTKRFRQRERNGD